MAKKQSMESMEGSVMAASKKSKSKGKKWEWEWEVGSGKLEVGNDFFLLNVLNLLNVLTVCLLFLFFHNIYFYKQINNNLSYQLSYHLLVIYKSSRFRN